MLKIFFAHEYSLTTCVGASLCTMLVITEGAYLTALVVGLITIALGVWGELRLEKQEASQ